MKNIYTLENSGKEKTFAIMSVQDAEQGKNLVISRAKAVAKEGHSKVILPGVSLEIVSCEAWAETAIKILSVKGTAYAVLAFDKKGQRIEGIVEGKASEKSVFAYVLKQNKLQVEDIAVMYIRDLHQKVTTVSKEKSLKEGELKMKFKSPVYNVKPVPVEKIRANEYNPNSVAPAEMKLLYDSIREDGYTMPIVCYYNEKEDVYEIVDGFHRYSVMLKHKDIYDREGGVMPVAVIDKPIDERMASTIRHNRARGSHDVDLMSHIVAELYDLGRSDAWIAKHLGMDLDEIMRLKQITGLAALFKDNDFSKSWGGIN